MRFPIDALEALARTLGIGVERPEHGHLVAELSPGLRLVFRNLPGNGGVAGFEGMSWHWHGNLLLTHDNGRSFSEFDAASVLHGLTSGEVLVAEMLDGKQVTDRWLVHRGEATIFRHMHPGEGILVRRLT